MTLGDQNYRGMTHDMAVCRSLARPGRWVACVCGWVSPDLVFPTDAEALEWAHREHQGSEAT